MSRTPVDLTNRVFGRLTALEWRGTNHKGVRVWLCRCACGEEVILPISSLNDKSGTRSCGCLTLDRNAARTHDLTGRIMGRLTVVDKAGSDKSGSICWNCICKCGRRTIVTISHLVRGTIISCGCALLDTLQAKALDLSGQVFGRLTVIERAKSPIGSLGGVRWLCLCTCGSQTIQIATKLRSGRSVSCGCAATDRDPLLTPPRLKLQRTASSHTYHARKRQTGGVFTPEDIQNRYVWQRGRCALPHCRAKLKHEYEIDHIVPISARNRTGGQIPLLNDRRNIQLLCKACNKAKSDHDPIRYNQGMGFLL